MSQIEKELIQKAQKMYASIKPCGKKQSLQECFTKLDNEILFWFNTPDGSTHLLSQEH